MNSGNIEYSVLCGKTRRNLKELVLSIGKIEQKTNGLWEIRVSCSGYLESEEAIDALTEFDSLIMGLTFFRQKLREAVHQDERLKFYVSIDDELVEKTIEDIFFTYDCVTDEMEEMINWAKKNGYPPD